MNFSALVKQILHDKITALAQDPSSHVRNPRKDFSRERKLNFPTMMKSIICMGAGTTKDELLEFFDYDAQTASTSAFVQQRDKIKSSAFESLFKDFNDAFEEKSLYKDYRLLAVDGTSLSIFADPKDTDNYFKRKHESKGFSNLHLNACYDLITKRYLDVIIQSCNKKNEHQAMRAMINRSSCSQKTIFIADRGYESYNNFATVEEKFKNYLIRVKDRDSHGILRGLVLPNVDEFDIDVDFILTRKQTNFVKSNPDLYKLLPSKQHFDFMDENIKEYPMKFRVIRFKLTEDSYEAIITNLCRDSFSILEIKNLYNLRWGIETSFRHLKYVVGITCFHAKKVESIKQEIFARLILHNFCEIITAKIIIKKKQTKYHYQLNFTRAFRICRQFLRFSHLSGPPDVEKLILKELLPVRPNRICLRNVRPRTLTSTLLYRVI